MATRVSRSRSRSRAASPKRKSASPKRRTSRSPRRMSRRATRRTSRSPRRMSKARKTTRKTRKVGTRSAYSNYLKMQMKKMKTENPGMTFGQMSAAIAKMWKSASAKTKSAVRKMVRSPRKVRKMRSPKRRALKKSGSPRRTRKDKGSKTTRPLSAYNKFISNYYDAKSAALGTKNQKMVFRALAADWRAGVRSY